VIIIKYEFTLIPCQSHKYISNPFTYICISFIAIQQMSFSKDFQYYKFCFYGFLKNLRFFDAFFLLYLNQKGLTYTEIGSLYAIREMLTYLSEVPTGIIADTYGRKNSLVFSFLAYISSFLLFYAGTDYKYFLLAFIFYGLADAFRSGTHKAMIMDYLHHKNRSDEKINYYGHTRACSQRGSALSALLGGIIVLYSGNYQFVFLLSTIPYLLNLILILSYPSYLNGKSGKHTKSIKQSFIALWQAIKTPKVFGIIHSAAVFTAFQKTIKDYIQPIMKSLALAMPVLIIHKAGNQTGLWIGLMYFVLFLLTATASSYAGKIAESFTKITQLSLLIGLGLGIVAGFFFHLQWVILSLLAFAGIYIIENIRKPVLTGFLSDQVPNEILASVISAQSLYRSILTALLSLGLGYLTDQLGLGYALTIISFGLLVSGLLSRIAKRM